MSALWLLDMPVQGRCPMTDEERAAMHKKLAETNKRSENRPR
jgi:hypothetical protein